MRTAFSPARRCLFLLALLLSAFAPAFSQTKKGFAKLKSERFDAACQAFALDTANAELRPAAYFGMAEAWADEKNPAKDYRTAMQYQEEARGAWRGLKSAQRAALTKKFNAVTFSSIEQLRRTTATNAWKQVENTTSLREIDEFIDVFPKNAGYIDRKAREKQSELRADFATRATTYADLSYLYNRHLDSLRRQLPERAEPLENSVFDAFMREKNIARIDDFYRENPRHPTASDPARATFPATWQSATLPPMLDFLERYPGSKFAPYIRQKAAEVLKTNPLDENAKQALPENQRLALRELEWIASGKTVNPNGVFREADQTGWLLYIRQYAPLQGALAAAEKIFQYHVGRRDWEAAAALLRETKPLFPRSQPWFDDRLAMVAGPVYGIKPVSAGPTINTAGSEYVPVLTADGKRLYFGGDNRADNVNGEDVFVSERRDTGWTKPVLVAELSGEGHQAPLSLTADGNRILLFNRAKPFQSDRTASGWTAPQPLPVDVSEFAWVGMVQIAANNQVMFLEARKGNSFNQTDLYIARMGPSGQWSKPIRLDAVINTDADDRSPFLHPDMRTLYFSSEGHAGFGGMDVFKSTRLDDTWLHWSRPVNLGKEINTPGLDWSYRISTDGATAWFAAETEGHGQDIFYIALPDSARPQQVNLVIVLVKDESGTPLREGQIVLKDAVTGDEAGAYRVDPTGGGTPVTVPNDKQYLAVFVHEQYYPVSIALPKQNPGQGTKTVTIIVPKLAAGVTQALNIFFDYDQAVLRPESNAELQQVVALAQKEGYRVRLVGHTDNSGSPTYNLDLSKRRAEAARTALIGMGLPADRVIAEGRGETEPLVPNDTDAHRAQNRRVMMQLLKK